MAVESKIASVSYVVASTLKKKYIFLTETYMYKYLVLFKYIKILIMHFNIHLHMTYNWRKGVLQRNTRHIIYLLTYSIFSVISSYSINPPNHP